MSPSSSEARPRLHVGHAVAVCVGMVIGAGIFRTSPEVAAALDSEAALLLAWLLGGLLSVIGGLCFAELAAAYPDQGGDYSFLRRAYGAGVGFLFAWSRFAVIHSGSVALLAFVFGDYLNQLLPLGPGGSAAFGASLIVLLVALNLRGVKVGVGTQLGLMLIVAAGLLAVGSAGLVQQMQGLPPADPVSPAGALGFAAFGQAMIFVLLAYGGWSDAATLSAEVADPKRDMPLALGIGLGLVLVLYLLVNWAYLRGLGLGGLAASQAPAADLMRLAFGRTGEVLIVAVVAVTAITVMNAILIAGARTTFAAARDLGFAGLGAWDTTRGVPRGALFGLAGVSLALVALGLVTRGGFSTLVDYLSPVYWGFLMLSGVAVILLRRRDPARPRAFRVPLYPLLPLLFSASCAYLLYSSLVYVREGALVAVAVLFLGGLLWIPLRRRAQA